MLGRQWQMSELKGEDAGTPIHVKLNYTEGEVHQVQLGAPTSPATFDEIGGVPLEVLVEREDVEWDWRLRVRAGQQFERIVLRPPVADHTAASALIQRVRQGCPIVLPDRGTDDWRDLDSAARRYLTFMSGRAINGETLMNRLADPALNIPADIQTTFTEWWNRLYTRGPALSPPAWQPERLAYEFSVRSRTAGFPGPLHAGSYRTGSLDWSAYTLVQQTAATFETNGTLDLTPTHATFSGQPMRRWWEFEDKAVDFGSMDIAKTDIGKLLLMEFALIFGDDWFVVPLTARSNTMLRVQKVEVHDCFGQTTSIDPARDTNADLARRWEMFALSPDVRNNPTSSFIHVPPFSGTKEESTILEEVRFARDEDANVVFAIEHTVPNQLGEPVGGFTAHLETLRRWREYRAAIAAAPATDTVMTQDMSPIAASTQPTPNIRYVLATKVPANWIPFIPTDASNWGPNVGQHSVKLQRAAMVQTDAEDERHGVAALSRLMGRGTTSVTWIEEETVGREGVRVELRRQRTRGADGNTYVWLGRRVGVGKGEARSGLRFDVVKGGTTT